MSQDASVNGDRHFYILGPVRVKYPTRGEQEVKK